MNILLKAEVACFTDWKMKALIGKTDKVQLAIRKCTTVTSSMSGQTSPVPGHMHQVQQHRGKLKDVNKTRRKEREREKKYGQRVRELEHASFVPLVFTGTGGAGPAATTFLKATCRSDFFNASAFVQ